ncbi:MAG: pyridoxal phosphate-dependent aminotransferase [Myxococcota bacterium]
MRLAARLHRIAPSATLALNAQAQEMKAAGEDVVSLTAGEPDFPMPQHIAEAMKSSLDRGETRYTAVAGIAPLRRAIADRYREFGVTPDQTVVTTGGKQAIFNAVICTVEEGDEVIIPAPHWLSYVDIVRFVGGVPVVVPTDESSGFALSAGQLASALTDRTRMVIINSPSNPTGGIYSNEALGSLLEVVRPHKDLLVMFDEIYDQLVYEDARFASPLAVAPELSDRIIIVNGGSKAFAMTGVRIGWALAPSMLVTEMSKLQGQSTSNASAPSQHGLLAALQGDQACVASMRNAFDRRRRLVVDRLRSLPGLECFDPRGAFYVFPRVSALFGKFTPDGTCLRTASDFAAYLLKQEKLVVVPGEPFGSDQHVRLSFAVSEAVIDEGLERLGRAMNSLR